MSKTATKVLFVCTGNTCRSPMAAALLNFKLQENKQQIHISSAGVAATKGQSASFYAQEVLADMGIDISGHTSSLVTEKSLLEADLICTMSTSHKSALLNALPELEPKIDLLSDYIADAQVNDVPDPFGGDKQQYLKVRDTILSALPKLLQKIQTLSA